MSYTMKVLKVSEVLEPTEALRTVDVDTEKFVGLVESIKLEGILNPIAVREIQNEETGETVFGLVDGLHRLTAAKYAGLDEIPCNIRPVEDDNLLEAQIMANVHKIETRPVEYSKALLKILNNNALLTKAELANRLAKTSSWIGERLGLLKLTEEIGELVDGNKIGLSNAYVLAKLDPEEQTEYVDRAMTMAPQQFTPIVNNRIKEIRDARRKGKDAGPAEFVAVPLIRKKPELIAETELSAAGPSLCQSQGLTTAEEGFRMGVLWALQIDPVSAEVQKAKDEQRKAERAVAKEAADIERTRKKAKDAATKAETLRKEADEMEKKEADKQAKAAAEASA